ncbi:thioesterase domain-containing protein [Streptomyces sp. NPDC048110]|uniref:thioesterase II family protein n=1 Tax=Streptomyces sp. NPDC048110 TaxID=3155483 RepID=UPI0033F43C99
MRTDAAARHSHPEHTPTRGVGSPWIVGRVTAPDARLRLICLPQAGGSAASFAPWRLDPPPGVELATVELPGRGVRSSEPLPDTLEELADAVLDGIAGELRGPYAFFGHSFGALIGYELAVRVRRSGLTPPAALLVSASRAPHARVLRRVTDCDDEGLLSWLEGFGGFPPELHRYPAYLRYAVRTVRRDLALAEAYTAPGPAPVGCPLHVFGGADDPLVSRQRMEGWRECADDEFSLRLLPGGHDYPFTHAGTTLDALGRTLGRLVRSAPPS